ncbi:indoleamine 2,3-dioxygenase family protein [Hypoxylon cercidicola]|nr:indoleamine 2,3-dioxygenase family protein [Hypoxylon cercidicola]
MSTSYSPLFGVLDDTKPHDVSLPAFMVSTTRGFLPRMDPITVLPPEFEAVETLLQRMPIWRKSGKPGLLATGELGDTVLEELPDLSKEIEKYRDNLPMMTALYRDYSFLASAFLLEPCHMRFLKGEPYGLGRPFLPTQLSRPIVRCAELAGFKPFMEYAGSYALFNYRLENPNAGLEYSNLRLIRAFERGLDHESSEAGFVLVHIDMVKNSGQLVHGVLSCFRARLDSEMDDLQRRRAVNEGLRTVVEAMQKVNNVMETMWMKSKPRSYTSFRTFIFGITSQSMFPNGVVYEGVNDNRPLSFRGESGANDSMIPLMDNFLDIPMPDTPLSEILNDFRDYRPGNHRQFLVQVKEHAKSLRVKDHALGLGIAGCADSDEDRALLKESQTLWLQALDQVRDFRWRHWCFAREYILKQTSHPTATGGSPIVTWLPNQLQAVMEEMMRLNKEIDAMSGGVDLGSEHRDMMDRVERQYDTLRKEVEKYCQERGVGAY